MNQGVHTIDLMLWLCGPAKSVYAQTRTLGHERIEVEDCVSATVTFESGAIGTVTASTAAYPGFPVRLAIHGTRGSAILEGDAIHAYEIIGEESAVGQPAALHALSIATGGTRTLPTSTVTEPTAASCDGIDDPFGAPAKWGDSHRAQLADFARCCRTGERPRVDGHQGRAAVELILAIYESARTGNVVEV